MKRIVQSIYFIAISIALCSCHYSNQISLFDGKMLNGWEGNKEVFRIENGAMIGGRSYLFSSTQWSPF